MKIIDLLNKIANGEEVPKKIAIQNKVLVYNEDEILNLQDCYYMNDDEDATWEIWAYELNDEIEILDDEEKGLPKKLDIDEEENGKYIIWNTEFEQCTTLEMKIIKRQDYIINKINEIIDYLEKQRKGE